MPFKRRRRGRKSKFVTKRGLPFQLMKFAETKYFTDSIFGLSLPTPADSSSNRLINLIRIGTFENERIGQKIQVSGYYIRMTFEAVNTNSMRFMRVVCTPLVL